MSAGRLTEDQRALAADPRHVAAARRWSRTFARRHPHADADALESAALLGLCQAARGFDPGRGVPFLHFMSATVRGYMRNVLREQMPRGFRGGRVRGAVPGTVPLTVPDRDGSGAEWDFGLAADELPVGWEVDSEDAVRGLLARLGSRRNAKALAVLFLDARSVSAARSELSPKSAGAVLGVGEKRVTNALATARAVLTGSLRRAE